MSIYPEKALGEILKLDIDTEAVQPDKVYTTAGIYSYGRGLFRRATIFGAETKYKRYTRLHEGQFVYSKLFGWEGALAVVTKEFDGLHVSHEFPTFTVDQTVADLAYVRHLARWEGLHAKLRDQGTGMGSRRQRVNINRLLATTVPLPDLEEQRRIAARLDAALAKLDQAGRLRDHRSRLCAALVESMVADALEQETHSVRLGDYLVASRTPVEIDPDQKYQALGMRSFGRGTIRYPPAKGSELSKLRYYKFSSGTLALSNIKAWEGAIAIATEDDTACVASNRFLFYSAIDQRLNIRFLKHYLLSRRGLAQISACSPGSADRNRTLSIKRFEGLKVPLPAREKQKQVASVLDAITEEVRPEKVQEMEVALRTSLLNSAFSGEL